MRIFALLALMLSLAVRAAETPGTGGIGIALGIKDDEIVVRGILTNSPAAAQKTLRVGDRIIAVAQSNDAPVQLRGAKLADAVPLLRGPTGTMVRVTVVAPGEEDSQARVVSFVRGELNAFAPWGDGVLLTTGTKAPDIEMMRLGDGTLERLSNHAGKIIVLEFWATWCGPCQPKMADLQTCFAKHPGWKDKVALVAASVDEVPETAIRHLKARGWDQTHNVWVRPEEIKAYHVNAIPTAYIIDRQGNVAAVNPLNLQDSVSRELEKQGTNPSDAKE